MQFSSNGHCIDFEWREPEGATPSTRAVVLVHGLTIDRRAMIAAWEPVLDRSRLRRLYFDLPGHGASTGNAAHASADDLVESLAALLRAVLPDEAPPPLLVGYSYGGYLAQGLLRERTFGGLFLACPVVEPDFAKRHPAARFVAACDENLPFSDDPREREAFCEVAVQQTRAVLSEFQRAIHPANVSVDADMVGAIRYRYAMARPYLDAIAAFERPTTIVCGRHDHWVGFEDALTLVRALRRSSFMVVDGTGNLLPFEAPEAFRGAARAWLDRVARESSP